MISGRAWAISLALVASFLVPHLAKAASELAPLPLGELTAQLYSYALRVAGLAVFLMFLVAGLAKIVPSIQKKVGTPTAIIQDAIIGLVILVSAFVILNSINRDLVTGSSPSAAPRSN